MGDARPPSKIMAESREVTQGRNGNQYRACDKASTTVGKGRPSPPTPLQWSTPRTDGKGVGIFKHHHSQSRLTAAPGGCLFLTPLGCCSYKRSCSRAQRTEALERDTGASFRRSGQQALKCWGLKNCGQMLPENSDLPTFTNTWHVGFFFSSFFRSVVVE